MTGIDVQPSTPPPPESCNVTMNRSAELTIRAEKVWGPAAGLAAHVPTGDEVPPTHEPGETDWRM